MKRAWTVMAPAAAWMMLLAACGSAAAPPSAGQATVSPGASVSKPAGSASAAPPTKPAASYNPTPLSPNVKIQYADNQTLLQAPIYIALDRGYYKQEGLDVELNPLPVTQVMQALASSQVAFGSASPDPVFFNAIERGLDIRLIAPLTKNETGYNPAAMLVRKDLVDGGQYKSPKDLKGKNFGVPSPQSQFYVDLFMRKDGLTVADVNLITMNLPDMVAAFTNKGIDVAWSAEPFITVVQSQGLARAVAGTSDLFPHAVAVALAVSPQFATGQPEAAQRFVNATLRGMRDYHHAFIQKDTDKAPVVQILVSHTAVKDPNLYNVIGMSNVEADPVMDASTWDPFQDFFIKSNMQQRRVDLSKYVDSSYLIKASERLGRA